ncbi:hypothetical protein T11_15963 [Trichinella zimbabwensis]|uniref:Uncharacterized protein n=1 Tax=Trichinella zimbabwensis TaxID=268475 RepID=A0A0V1GN44_9BILA|nr:hypothetical protein T11_15963 [Trichinella zimbabwensis]
MADRSRSIYSSKLIVVVHKQAQPIVLLLHLDALFALSNGSSVQRGNKANACQVKSASQSLNNQPSTANTQQAIPQLDKQLPFANYREWYSLKNFWKTIQRNKDQCAKILLLR